MCGPCAAALAADAPRHRLPSDVVAADDDSTDDILNKIADAAEAEAEKVLDHEMGGGKDKTPPPSPQPKQDNTMLIVLVLLAFFILK